MSFQINLAANPAETRDSAALANLTPLFSSWRHCTRDIGGNWQAEGVIDPNTSDTSEMEQLFLQLLGKRIQVSQGQVDYWEGQITRLELTKRGQTFVRSMENMANHVKVIYSKVGDNLLSAGDVESASWEAYATPDVIATCNNWYAAGSTSMYCQADAANVGMIAGSGLAGSRKMAFDCSMITNVASGPWTLEVVASTNDVIASRETSGCGRTWLQCQVPDTNLHEDMLVRIISTHDHDEVYADAAYLRTSGVRSETKWWVNESSKADYGRIEAVYLEREMTDDEADGFAQRKLAELAWPRTKPAERGQTAIEGMQDDSLIVTCQGTVWSMTWRNARTDGTADADTHMTSLVDEAQLFDASDGAIDTNGVEVYIESGDPVTIWRHIEKIIKRGDDSGTSWVGGGYPQFRFRYGERISGTQYQFSNGRMEWYGGGAIQPLEFAPGWCLMVDMPTEPIPEDDDDNDPRRVWLAETWFVYEHGQVRLEWTREEDEDEL